MALGRLFKCGRSLFYEPCKGVLCGFLHSRDWRLSCVQAKRHLLTEDVIKLQEFQQKKLAVAHLITRSEGNFIELFHKKLQKRELILRDELKLLLHLCQSPDDMVVARDAIYRYHAENLNFAHGEFRFGPLFMRLCYELGLEEMAAATIKDKRLEGFFNDSTSFNIAIDMLFTKGAYESALDILRTMQIYNIPFNKDTLILAFGTCYKLNTPESYKICTTLIEESQSKGHLIPRQAYCFAIALALEQNYTDTAQSLYSQIMNAEGRLCKNLKILILAKSGELEELTSVFYAALHKTPAFIKKPEFTQDVVDVVRLYCEGGSYMREMNQIVFQLEQAGQVIQQSLDDLLCHTPAGKRKQWPIMQDNRRITSRRTLKPLNSSLLSD
ncbi:pentatricopeptide repeat-containing protein 2, mitochondrial [Boleophthalmus pectinirostris]|uniref:pentatricopeptide repeat-containing protein 2, mitochondrial n=1 Tax=Boleophthalmus pectinirostris TaxID=150288 RepID=UPI002431965A|nr:pentatricopeptide repeat-containing protein 2, mitochondrial [Boleophthalmus pectinirostris]